MRLIDADVLKEYINEARYPSDFCMSACELFEEWVNNQPTAYDVEKVVEELRKERIGYDNWDKYESGVLDGLAKAIDIVKRGGVDK